MRFFWRGKFVLNVSQLARLLRKILEAASGFEPLNGGFADLSLNHLGTPPRGQNREDTYHGPELVSITT